MQSTLKRIAIGAAALAVSSSMAVAAVPARPTFTKDVLPILQENCQTCHRPGGANLSGMIAPMSFMSYQETRPWAKAIVKAVQSREMPPWGASEADHGKFENERVLTKDEIATLTAWSETGAKRGNAEDAPAPMEFPDTGWNFGKPDLVIDFPEPFFVEDDVQDLYENITVKISEEQLPEDRWIKGIEFKPGSEVVHHIIGYASMPGEAGSRTSRGMLGGNAPGTDEAVFDEGYGILLKKGSEVTFAMHYHKEAGPGTGMYDSSQIGIQFHDAPVQHPVEISTVAHGNFEIPPFAKHWKVGASRTMIEDTHLMAMMPHTHLRGSEARYTAYYPDGTVEELLHVPSYDFNWQISYDLKENKFLPKGTRIEMEFWYDNSQENADQSGFNPARAIRFGGPTTDEMDLAWITIAPAKPMKVADAAEEGSTATGD